MVLLVLVACAAAQDSMPRNDSTQFHRGQWAAQFSAGFNFGSLGALKFRSPTHALLLDLRVTGSHAEQSFMDSTGTHFGGLGSRALATLRFGWRRYQQRHTKVAPHYTVGLLTSFSHQVSRSSSGGTKDESWQAGAFADLGATYLVTPQLGIGALAGVNLTYEWGNARSSAAPRRHYWTLSGAVATPTLLITLFF